MTTDLDEFDNGIRDFAEREKECDCLFEQIVRTAMLAGLTRIKKEMAEARKQKTTAPNGKQTKKNH